MHLLKKLLVDLLLNVAVSLLEPDARLLLLEVGL